MESFNYKSMFSQALQKIKNIRNPHAKKAGDDELRWEDVERQVIFDFGADELEEYSNTIKCANEISVSCLNAIIVYLAKEHYGKHIISINTENLCEINNPRFAIADTDSKVLYVFRDIEKGKFWKATNEPESILGFLKKNNLNECKYIYLMYEKAYLQVIEHDENETDPAKGTNLYSLMDFFDFYFNVEERKHFEVSLYEYVSEVSNCIGYIFVKSLTPNTLINFRKLTEHYIVNQNYDDLLGKKYNGYEMKAEDYPLLERQFFDDGNYQMLLGHSDFAESIITAEWLYSSMMKAKAIDLTVIGMGYLKAIEQLLFELIKIKNKDMHIDEKDFTIGAIATYYKNKNHMNKMLRNDIQYYTKTYIKEAIFAYAELRNGYFHKHNIHDENKIIEIRKETYHLAFLLLGAHKLTEDDKIELGIPERKLYDDFYRLCEYMNYHAGDFFMVCFQNKEIFCVACNDMKTQTIDNRYVKYSGVYLREINEAGRGFVIENESMVDKIILMKFVPEGINEVRFRFTIVKTIYEKGKFLGPAIVDEVISY